MTEQEPAAVAQREGLSDGEVRKHERIAEFNAHPHTRLTALAADLGTKRVDLHDRIGALHRVLAGVIGLALTHTPPPRSLEEPDEVG